MRNQRFMGVSAQLDSHNQHYDKQRSFYNILILAIETIGFFLLMSVMVNGLIISDILDSILMGVR